MNCSQWEERIALYAGGDLGAGESAAVEQHVTECAGCDEFLSGLKLTVQFLNETKSDQVEASHFTVLRARVLAQLRQERRPFWRRAWAWAPLIAAVACLVVAAFWYTTAPAPPPVRHLTAPPVAAVLPVPAPVPGPPVARERQPRKVRVREARPAEQVMVRVLTKDPDVVIYWIAETRGD